MDLAMLLYLLLLTCTALRTGDTFLPEELPDLYEVMHQCYYATCFKIMCFAHSIFHQAWEKWNILPLWSLCFRKGNHCKYISYSSGLGKKQGNKMWHSCWLLGLYRWTVGVSKKWQRKEISNLRLQGEHYFKTEWALWCSTLKFSTLFKNCQI